MRVAISLACLLLAACSGGEERQEARNAEAGRLDIDTLPPDESSATPTNSLAAGVTEPVVIPDAAIPAPFHGRWGLTADACAASEPVPGLITISANNIRFHNSMASAARIREIAPTILSGEFNFVSEEGRRWSGPMSWTIEGRRLVRVDSEPASRLVYSRC